MFEYLEVCCIYIHRIAPMGTFTQLNKPWFYCLTWTKRHPRTFLFASPFRICRRISYEHSISLLNVNLKPYWFSHILYRYRNRIVTVYNRIICVYLQLHWECKNACVIDQLTRSVFYLIWQVWNGNLLLLQFKPYWCDIQCGKSKW